MTTTKRSKLPPPPLKITYTFSGRPEDAKYLLDGLRAHYEKTKREREKAALEP